LIAGATLFFAVGGCAPPTSITEAEANVIAEEQFESLWGRTYGRNGFNDPELSLVTGCGGHLYYQCTWDNQRENLRVVIRFRREYKLGADATWLERIDKNKPCALLRP